MTQQDIMQAARCWNDTGALEQLLDAIREHFKPPPELTCGWCGCTESDTDDYKTHEWPGLVDVTVEVADMEEGHARVRRYVCSNEFDSVMEPLKALGFVEHHHGGICFLEADETDCGGYGKCTLREEY